MALQETRFQFFFNSLFKKYLHSQSFQFMILNAFKQLERNEIRKVVRFSLDPLPRISSLPICCCKIIV